MSYQILLVDDDREFRDELRDCLSDYRVIEAAHGQQALEIMRKPNAIDLVVLDVVMPGLSGTDVLKEIRKINPAMGIIMLTGNSSKDVVIEALKGHADDYIEKPFDAEKFLKTVHKVLLSKSNGKAGSPVLTGGKMERVKAFLQKNYDKKVGLKDVAQEICLSPKYLSRIFKEKTGGSFNDYRLKIKIEMAQQLLSTSSVSIQELSDKLGYKNLESFVRIYKKITGQTPSTYRQKVKGKSHAKHKINSNE